MQNGYQDVNELLNIYIRKIAGFMPADYSGDLTRIDELVKFPPRRFTFKSLKENMKKTISDICHTYLFTSNPNASKIALGSDEQGYIESGFARFRRDSSGARYLTIDETLVLLTCSLWLNQELDGAYTLYRTLADGLGLHNASTGRNQFEEFVCLYLQKVLQKPKPLNQVFDFLRAERLGEKVATLVTLHRARDGTIVESQTSLGTDGVPKLLGPIGLEIPQSGGIPNLVDWLKLKGRTAFCFPMNNMGPDIMCFLKLMEDSDVNSADSSKYTYICLAIQCKFWQRGVLGGVTLRDAVATISPSEFFAQRVS